MATLSIRPNPYAGVRISLERIDAIVSARLGPTRIPGNSQPACFNRQVAMYLATRVGRHSTTAVGTFYNGRDHSTVCHGIQRVEALREHDPDVDALLCELASSLKGVPDKTESNEMKGRSNTPGNPMLSREDIEMIAELVAIRVWERLGLERK